MVLQSFDRLLRHQRLVETDQPSLLERSSHRESLLKCLSESTATGFNTQHLLKLSSVVRITDFSLPESQTTFKHETPGTIWDWLRQQRSGDQTSAPTFMFPDINAGPDLVFSLQKQSTNSGGRNVRQSRPTGQLNKLVIISQVSHLQTFTMRIEITFSHNNITRSRQAEEPGLKMQ